MKRFFVKNLPGFLLLHSANALCEYNVPNIVEGELPGDPPGSGEGTVISGFEYSNLWEAEFPPHWTGVGNVTIALPEGYTTNKWTIQFRWPLELNAMECFTNSLKEQDCGGDPTNSVDGETCVNQHYHLTPHFYDGKESGSIQRMIYSHWPVGTQFDPDGPIPCVDWCDNGEVPEYPGPCGVPTTPAPTISPEQCQSDCYDQYFACVKACDEDDAKCASDCSRIHYECFNACTPTQN